jgi:AraC-like DNA-binding protein
MDNWTVTSEPLLQLISAGHEVHRPGSSYLHDCLRRTPPLRVVLQLTLAGTAFHLRGGRRSLLTPGMAFLDLLPGPWSYGIAQESSVPYEQVFAAFAGESSFALAQRAIGRFGNVLDLGRDSPLAAPMMDLAWQYLHGRTTDRYLVSGRIYELCMLLLSHLGRQETRTCPVVGEALRLIGVRAADPAFNVEALARALRCSRSHLTRRFIAATASTPLQYLIQYRLDLARRQVRGGDRPIREIAVACGFASDNYFCRLFRRRYRVTPMADRRAARA